MHMHKMIEFNALNHPGVTALRCGDQTLSYAELNDRAERLAAGLQQRGIAPGQRIALLAKNCIEYPLLLLASMKLGSVLVPLNFRLASAELSGILRDSQSTVLIVGDAELRAIADNADCAAELSARFTLEDSASDWESFDSLLGDAATLNRYSGDSDSTVLQLYTSGTTGLPKGVMIAHRQLSDGYIMTAQIPPRLQVADTGIMPLLLFHVAGIAASLFWLCNGLTVELMADFNPVAVVDGICRSQGCDIVLVPAMIQAILAFVPDLDKRDFSPLRRITYGASPISLDTLRAAIRVFDCDFVQGFGMTELSCMVLCLQSADHQRALAGEEQLLRSCGRPLPGCELKVVNEQGEEVAPGETGELLVRSGTTMQGYWQQPEKTAETVVDGWLHTGDAGYVDEEGFFYIRDRVKDMIVSGGENIYPAEVENVLFAHPAIADVAVIGVPDAKFGEAPLAVCVLAPEQSTSDEALIEFCKAQLASYKTPRQYAFVEEIPRNPSGKVLKRVLREPYWQASERRVG